MDTNSLLRSTLVILGLILALGPLSASARDDNNRWASSHGQSDHGPFEQDRRQHPDQYHRDVRYRHDHYYPRTGYVVRALPPRYDRVHYRDRDYFFFSGVWYLNDGPQFTVVAPPIGIIVPTLPAFYTTLWIRGIPYYYANETYYVWRPDQSGYEVTTPPPGVSQQQPRVITDELFVYPKNGQSDKQQADDRFACHQWSVKQTGFDPSLPPQNMTGQEMNGQRDSYQRAMRACLEGRGYSVR